MISMENSSPAVFGCVVARLNSSSLKEIVQIRSLAASVGLQLCGQKNGCYVISDGLDPLIDFQRKIREKSMSETDFGASESGTLDARAKQKYCFFCSECPFKTGRSKLLIAHRKQHESGRQLLTCSLCPSFATFNKSFHAHHQNKHKKSKLGCSECSYSCFGDRTLKNHYLLHHRLSVQAEKSGEDTAVNLILREERNQMSSGPSSLISCSFCQYTCSKMSRLKRHHESVHENLKKFKCSICLAGFKRSDYLVAHTKRAHSGQLKSRNSVTFQCSVCEKELTKKCNLLEHEESHKTENDVLCDVCGKHFKSRASLRKHQRAFHSTEQEFYNCDLCRKTFKTRDGLNRHLKTKNHLSFLQDTS